jgi:dihydropteroate synthase
MNRKIYHWKLRSVELQLGAKTLIMGILNVTPDSFSDGGRYSDPDRAYARALELEEQGADIIDIGAESTRPGSQRVSAEEEWRRLAPVLKRLRDKLTVPLSLDTYKAEIAERAFEYGIEIVNDPSGLTFDADLAKTAANANAGLILNHMRGTPETWAKLPPLPDMPGTVFRDLEATINRARRAGVERNRIAVDPGLGFGKRREQDCEILAQLSKFVPLECPVVIGPSRKSFLAEATESETICATAAAVAVSIMNGAHIVRVHDVKEMRAAAQVADEVVRAVEIQRAAQEAQQAAERPVPRRTIRPLDERPKSIKPPVAPKILAPVPAASEEAVSEEITFEPDELSARPETAEQPATATPPPPAVIREEARREPRREAKRDDFRKESRPAAKPYADRPLRRDFGGSKPPREDRPPSRRDSGDRPPRREFSDRPPRRDFGSAPPRRDFGDRKPKPFGTDGPPRRDFKGGKPFGERPPRREFSGPKPTGDSRPPRRDFKSGKPFSGDRPPRRDFSGPKPTGDTRPPRKDFRSARPSTGDRPPRRDSGPPRGKSQDGRGPKPPNRPFRKRP